MSKLDTVYNSLTPYLKKIIDTEWAKPSDKIFEVLGKRVDTDGSLVCGITFVSPKMILNNVDEAGNGELIEVIYSDGVYTVGDKVFNKPALGSIIFSRQTTGLLHISEGDISKKDLFAFLYLGQTNIDNQDKPFHVKPSSGYLYKMVNNQAGAESDLATFEIKDKAIIAIRELTPSKIKAIKSYKYRGQKNITDEIIKRDLRRQAETDPDGVIALVDDILLNSKATIIEAIDEGVIKIVGDSVLTNDNSVIYKCNNIGKFIDELSVFLNSPEGKESSIVINARLKKSKPQLK